MEDKFLVKIAEALVYLKNSDKYIKINKNDFKNVPLLEGYYIDLSSVLNNKTYLILNNEKKFNIGNNIKEIDGYYFIVINLFNLGGSLEKFLENLNDNSKIIITLLEKLIAGFIIKLDKDKDKDKTEGQYNLPYGYDRNKKGDIIVDKKESDMVRKIFILYEKQKSMKKVAEILRNTGFVSRKGEKVEFSTVSGILHDKRYLSKDLPISIIPLSLFNNIQQILQRNLKENKSIKYW